MDKRSYTVCYLWLFQAQIYVYFDTSPNGLFNFSHDADQIEIS